MIDNRTTRLNLALPNVDNWLEDDAPRIEEALRTLDGAVATIDETGKLSADQVPSNVILADDEGFIPADRLPPITITNTSVVASQAAMLALTAQTGDVAIRTDVSKTFILAGSNSTLLSHWRELLQGGGGIPDAPADGKIYRRKDSEWSEVAKGNPGFNGEMLYLSSTDITDMNDIPVSRYLINDQELVLSGPNFGRKWANQPVFDDEQTPNVIIYVIETVSTGQNQFGTGTTLKIQVIKNFLASDKPMSMTRYQNLDGVWSQWSYRNSLFPVVPYNKVTDGALASTQNNVIYTSAGSSNSTTIGVETGYFTGVNDYSTKNIVFTFELLEQASSPKKYSTSVAFSIDMDTIVNFYNGVSISSGAFFNYKSTASLGTLSAELSYNGVEFVLICKHDRYNMTKASINGLSLDELIDLGI